MGRLNQRYAVTRVTVEAPGDGPAAGVPAGDGPAGGSPAITVDTRADTVTAEEPLEIRVGGPTLTTTMRTPGHDIELAHGFLHGEGLIRSAADIREARYCAGATNPDGSNTYNVLDINLASSVRAPGLEHFRLTPTTSACGVCGSSSIDAILDKLPGQIAPRPIDPLVVAELPDALREAQKQFAKTGGIHAAAAFTFDGDLVVAREDIGRHNAADKVIGHLLLEGMLPADDLILVMSSRASFELVQKAAMAGFPALVAVSAPSSLAIDLARQTSIALVGFARGPRFNLYSGELLR